MLVKDRLDLYVQVWWWVRRALYLLSYCFCQLYHTQILHDATSIVYDQYLRVVLLAEADSSPPSSTTLVHASVNSS